MTLRRIHPIVPQHGLHAQHSTLLVFASLRRSRAHTSLHVAPMTASAPHDPNDDGTTERPEDTDDGAVTTSRGAAAVIQDTAATAPPRTSGVHYETMTEGL